MPNPAADFETRLVTVEREVAQLRDQAARVGSDLAAARADAAVARADAGTSRLLAAGADHDVSEVRAELRAHTQGLNALRETQLEHLREMREGFARLDHRIDEQGREMREQGREMREGFARLATGMAQITALLTNIAGSEGHE
ncbi:MAG: hypothetical protein ACT4NY_20410 [Pseudonocardiales bacterium]